MTRLLRPTIPLSVKLRVLCRQIAQASGRQVNIEQVVRVATEQRSLATFVDERLTELAGILNCLPEQFNLDHDPALINREKLIELQTETGWKRIRAVVVPKGGKVIRYYPDANDPEHLYYRIGGAGGTDHDVKTRVRGDHGQHSDLALARKNKRIEKRLRGDNKKPTFRQVTRQIEQRYLSKPPRVKRPIPSRPFPKGSRPIRKKP